MKAFITAHGRNILYIIGLTFAGTMIIYYQKGIYPFGTESLAYGDMDQMTIPFFYYLYDILKGKSGAFFSWNAGLGLNMAGIVSEFSLFSPLNLFLLLSHRENINNYVSILLIIKIIFMEMTMYYFLTLRHELDDIWKIILSVLYGFCSCVILYYQIGFMLDIAVIFPLIVLGMYRIFDDGKNMLYICGLSLALMTNVYISIMVVIFLVISSGLYLYFEVDRMIRNQRIALFIGSSLVAALISGFLWIPGFCSIMSSGRVGNNDFQGWIDTYISTMQNEDWALYFKVFLLCANSAFLVAVIISRIKRTKKYYHIFLMMFLILAVLVPATELLWHGGSRISWPVRFIFIVTFVLIDFSAELLSSFPVSFYGGYSDRRVRINDVLRFIFFLTGLFLFAAFLNNTAPRNGDDILKATMIGFVLLLVIYILAFRVTNKGGIVLICVCLGLEIFFNTFVWFAPVFFQNKGRIAYLEKANILSEETGGLICDDEGNALVRAKDYDGIMNQNYALISNMNSISQYVHVLSADASAVMEKLGYSVIRHRTIDVGGTIFTDALLGIKYTFANRKLNLDLYRFDRLLEGGIYWHVNEYCLPLGLELTEDIEFQNIFQYQNDLFYVLTQKRGLIENYENVSRDFVVPVEGRKILYLYSDGDDTFSIEVNGKTLLVPTMDDQDNLVYPDEFNNGLQCLGVFEDESVEIGIRPIKDIHYEDVKVGIFDLDLFDEQYELLIENEKASMLKSGKDSLTFSYNSRDNRVLFLPILYDKNWQCTLNKQKTRLKPIMNGFIGIPLKQGENSISLRYIPQGKKAGVLISIFGMVIYGVIFRKRCVMRNSKLYYYLNFVLSWLYVIGWICFICIFYLIPIACIVIRRIPL